MLKDPRWLLFWSTLCLFAGFVSLVKKPSPCSQTNYELPRKVYLGEPYLSVADKVYVTEERENQIISLDRDMRSDYFFGKGLLYLAEYTYLNTNPYNFRNDLERKYGKANSFWIDEGNSRVYEWQSDKGASMKASFRLGETKVSFKCHLLTKDF